MQTGTYISGAGHLLVIGWTLFGIHPNPDPLPFEVQSVSIVTGAEYAAILAAQRPPETTAEPAALTPPAEPAETPPEAPRVDPAPQPVPPPETQAPPPDPAPQAPAPTPPAEVVETVPQPVPPAEAQAALLPPSPRPQPRPADRVAPEAVAPPPPDATPDPVEREAVRDEPGEAATPTPPQEATAPEEAATEIVTEAEIPAGAPEQSIRPRARPEAPVAAAQPRPETPVETPEPAAETPAPSVNQDSVNAALAAALAGSAPSAPSGPPMTEGEKDGLRVAVSACWNVGSLSTEALGTTVVVSVTMTEDARPVQGSIRMLSYQDGSESAARQAFEAARRAIIRCGANGFGLPVEKFDHWREIEMTFNPERMRIK